MAIDNSLQQEEHSKITMATTKEIEWDSERKKIQYIDPVLEKQFLQKLDLRMVIWSFIASISNFLNRNNMHK